MYASDPRSGGPEGGAGEPLTPPGDVEIILLGPVELRVGGTPVQLGPPKQRALFAALALDADRRVPLPTLIERVWDDPTPGVRSSAYAHITHLRRALRDSGAAGSGIDIVGGSGGYTLRTGIHRSDLHRYRTCVARAANEATDAGLRAALYRAAIALRQGEPLAGIGGAWAAAVRANLLAQHLSVLLNWARCELRAGHPTGVAETLLPAVDDYPFSESLLEVLMRALAADGRSAEALEVYARRQRVFVDELGTGFGRKLRDLHTAILRDEVPAAPAPPGDPADAGADPSADPPGAGAPAEPTWPAPRQLPLDPPGFTGREPELDALTAMLAAPAEAANRLCCVCGTAGVGKSALALHWAHRVAGHFPDGQLYLDLRGFSPDRPVEAADALEILLRAVQGDTATLPPDLHARAARFRTALAGRRILLVLDNAASAEHVRPLLPGGTGCFTVVTSRRRLSSLVAREGAHRVSLDPLPAEAAERLLRSLLRDRIDAEPAAVAALVRRCGGLPLPLRVAAEAAVSGPHTSLAGLLGEAGADHQWLDLLDTTDDASTAVRRIFSWSYRSLDPPSARAFRLLGGHPGADVGEPAAAAMLDTDVPMARRLLRGLVDANLAVEATPGRFTMHDLLRAYAREMAEDRAATGRLLDHYLRAAARAMRAIRPAEQMDYPQALPDDGDQLDEPHRAMAWLHTERSNLLAAISHAADHGWPGHAVRLAATARRYLELRGYYLDVADAHRHALRAAQTLGDRRAEAIAHRDLGVVLGRANRNAAALEHMQSALALFRSVGDRPGEATSLGNLGVLYLRTSRAEEAERTCVAAVALSLEIDLPRAMAASLTSLGTLYAYLGRYEEAIDHHARAIAGFSALGLWPSVAAAQDGLAETYRRLGRYDDALVCLRQSLDATRASGHLYGESAALNNLGEVYRRTARPDLAMDCFQRSLAIAADLGDRRCEAGALNGAAQVLLDRGHREDAVRDFDRALVAADAAEDSQQRVRALIGLAVASWDDEQATRRTLHQALRSCTALETQESAEIKELLTRLARGWPAPAGPATQDRSEARPYPVPSWIGPRPPVDGRAARGA